MSHLIALFFIFTLEGHKFNNMKKSPVCIQKFLDFCIYVKVYLKISLEKLKTYLYN